VQCSNHTYILQNQPLDKMVPWVQVLVISLSPKRFYLYLVHPLLIMLYLPNHYNQHQFISSSCDDRLIAQHTIFLPLIKSTTIPAACLSFVIVNVLSIISSFVNEMDDRCDLPRVLCLGQPCLLILE
jgi:hypothetical protein